MFGKDLYDDYDLELCETFAIDIEEGEALHSFTTIARDYNLNVSLVINPDKNENLKNTEYFKFYNAARQGEATKIARIKFRSPEYVIHHNNGGKENWFLNSDEKKILMKLLRQPSDKHTGFSVWQSMIIDFNWENELDYKETKKNKQPNLPHPDYMPIDLEIPNYLELSK